MAVCVYFPYFLTDSQAFAKVQVELMGLHELVWVITEIRDLSEIRELSRDEEGNLIIPESLELFLLSGQAALDKAK